MNVRVHTSRVISAMWRSSQGSVEASSDAEVNLASCSRMEQYNLSQEYLKAERGGESYL